MGSENISDPVLVSLHLKTKGEDIGWASAILVFYKRSLMYLLLVTRIKPSTIELTSIPNK